ncbi:MAG: hypothetical protein K2X99_00785, partial [Gemmatimonadaceae bacterium]|nr:hypothetical protein [Gemmatimonadaceae bacterium]
MSRLWLDTAVWYAALDPREEWHALAVECWRAAMADGVRLHTSELVLAETHALVSCRLSPSAGAALLEAVERDPAIDVHEIGA